jgi:hypothetical protein
MFNQFLWETDSFAAANILCFSFFVRSSDKMLFEFAGSITIDNKGLSFDLASSNKTCQKLLAK